MRREITIRTYRPDDLEPLVAMINGADAIEQMDRATTVEELGHELSFPAAHPETDCFLAWAGDRLVGYTDLYVRRGDANTESRIYCWGLVHPDWRRRGVGRHLLARACRRAGQYAAEIETGRVVFQCSARDIETGSLALYESFGMERVRFFVNLVRPMNGNLPPVEVPDGIRLRTFDPGRDLETVWRVDNTAFRDHWGHTEGELAEFKHWIEMPHFRPELWLLAEETATGEVVGLGLNVINPNWIAQTGRQEGYVDTLAVLREHRKRGLGTALLLQSLHTLHGAGMDSVHLHADADNLTGAMRLYERVGFRVRKTSIAYHKVLKDE